MVGPLRTAGCTGLPLSWHRLPRLHRGLCQSPCSPGDEPPTRGKRFRLSVDTETSHSPCSLGDEPATQGKRFHLSADTETSQY